jgi:hypothetical protein
MVDDVQVIGKFADTDHNMLSWNLEVKIKIDHLEHSVLDYRNADVENLTSSLDSIDWQTLLEPMSTEEAWCTFKGKLQALESKYVPCKMVNSTWKKKPRSLTNRAFQSIRRKHKIYKKI